MPITDAIILAGGFGTRLKPLTDSAPKPLLSVGGRPFLESLFARLAEGGVRRVVLSVHHQAGHIEKALPGLRRFSLRVSLRREPKPLGTGGAIRFAWPDPARACLVLNGDVLSDFDVRELQKEHRLGRAAATLWAISVENTAAFGVIETRSGQWVTRFVEKPSPGQSVSRLINAGLYALEPSVLQRIAGGRPVSVEREVFPQLLDAGLPVKVCVSGEGVYWNDIGTPEAYLRANLDILRGRLWKGRGLAQKLWGKPDKGLNLVPPSARVAKGAKLSLSVLGPGCRVEEGAVVHGSVLSREVSVGEQSSVDGAILSQGVRVGARCAIKAGAVLGPDSRLSDHSRL
ncbi:MAG TPA: NDP-sugar synthase [bacterium]|jgi:mannose-1-phosphate guanylyltransferase|nr:NDP-sugar synthase [bacterium]